METSFAEMHAAPDYFRKENRNRRRVNFGQLDHYIRDLRQSGIDTKRLSVALWQKLSYPVVAVVMAVLAIPFALSMGRRGSLTGIAVAIALALAYRVIDTLFGAMGNVTTCRLAWLHGQPTSCSESRADICCCARRPDRRGEAR